MALSKTKVRKAVGRKPFAATELAAALDVTPVTARKHVEALVAEGKLSEAGIRKTGKRGRPAKLYKVS
jgi:predicted ArsR family transcriptional regulator